MMQHLADGVLVAYPRSPSQKQVRIQEFIGFVPRGLEMPTESPASSVPVLKMLFIDNVSTTSEHCRVHLVNTNFIVLSMERLWLVLRVV